MVTLQPGTQVDRYIVEDVLGKGTTGCVYRARDTRLGRRVAIKVLSPELSQSAQGAEAAARLRREAYAIAALEHPNAVQVFDFGESFAGPYIAMELIDGNSLRVWLGAPEVSTALKLRWLADAARALGAAHRAGIIHRDVKPDNILVRNDGMVKVLDFGIAQGGGDPQTLRRLTVEGRIVGTPAYMSPEQLFDRPLDGRSDQFSLGITAYELLSGGLPWSGVESVPDLMVKIVSQEIRDIPDPVGDLPPVVKMALLRTLKKNAAERFPTMEELVQVLDPWTAGAQAPAAAARQVVSYRSSPPPAHPSPRPHAPSYPPAQAVHHPRAASRSAVHASSPPGPPGPPGQPGQRGSAASYPSSPPPATAGAHGGREGSEARGASRSSKAPPSSAAPGETRSLRRLVIGFSLGAAATVALALALLSRYAPPTPAIDTATPASTGSAEP
ncbi:serine/threonine-protein kinase [Chondromyces crocatus]|nr:serine/threonine-protein kinase [Chondromyces crocatus]